MKNDPDQFNVLRKINSNPNLSQRDLANELNINSSRTSEIVLKLKEFYKKGGIFNVAKNLIHIEQNWLNNIKKDFRNKKEMTPYNQLDIDSLVNQINQDINN